MQTQHKLGVGPTSYCSQGHQVIQSGTLLTGLQTAAVITYAITQYSGHAGATASLGLIYTWTYEDCLKIQTNGFLFTTFQASLFAQVIVSEYKKTQKI